MKDSAGTQGSTRGDCIRSSAGADGPSPIRDLALLFLRLGATAFGGPAAHIAMMEEEVVRRRRWLTREEFLDLLGATNLIPGPNSTEMAIHVGRRRAGWPGLLVAGSCFILPAALIVLLLAWMYVRFRTLPQADALLYGIKPVLIAVVLQALWGLARTAVKDAWLLIVGGQAVLAALLGADEIAILLVAGALVAATRVRRPGGGAAAASIGAPGFAGVGAAVGAAVGSAAGLGTSFSLGVLFLVFLKIGAVLFGSGYVLLAFLRTDLVARLHWLTEGQLLDAVAIGQVTPGPVFTTATFVGYLLGGTPGAIVATVGIFLPAFLLVAASAPLVSRLRRSPTAGAFLDGVNVASLALMAVVCWHLGRGAIVDVPTALLAAGSAVLLLRFRVRSVWLVAAAGAAGLIVRAL